MYQALPVSAFTVVLVIWVLILIACAVLGCGVYHYCGGTSRKLNR
jgi:hypothetical protein